MKRKETSHTFEYKIEEKPNLSLMDLDTSKWLTMSTRTEFAPTPRGEVGWICPVCGRGLAPSMSWCPCYTSTATTVTSTAKSPTTTYTLDGIEEYDWTMSIPVGAIDYTDGSSKIIYPSVDDKSRSVD